MGMITTYKFGDKNLPIPTYHPEFPWNLKTAEGTKKRIEATAGDFPDTPQGRYAFYIYLLKRQESISRLLQCLASEERMLYDPVYKEKLRKKKAKSRKIFLKKKILKNLRFLYARGYRVNWKKMGIDVEKLWNYARGEDK